MLHTRVVYLRSAAILCLLIVIAIPELTVALKDVYVTVPTAVKRGDSAMLACNYDIENDTLYTVKWYKGRREFYRYTPKENPAMKIFKLPGINVESTLSNQSHVTLVSVPLSITGKFSCEVSADAPSFHTLIHTAEMEIVELPTQRPIITGIHSRYRLGDVINGNCSSDYSKPAANLTWWINEIAVLPNYIRTYEVQKHTEENLESSVLEINFIVTYQHFMKGRLKLKCTARIHEIYEQETEKVIEEDRPRILASGRSPDVNLYPFDQPGDGEFDEQNEQYLTHHYNKNASSTATAWRLDSKQAVKMAIVLLFVGLFVRHTLTNNNIDDTNDDNRNYTRIKIRNRLELKRNHEQWQLQQDFPTTESLSKNR
ncbi:uncharacterized protein LOC129954197 [Eupeodes corollae]|uniref:uncharacterized protein LOC129954197 n=1 Tax=Eupeodes corollae TaxID=290404 RepID=UPI0024923C8A|nr:uncharacterized protein LOC129954197 [Eupeodes corollae]XP_055923916.1 uncharacterized protein LOC129954197 [Eupeodes corollae]